MHNKNSYLDDFQAIVSSRIFRFCVLLVILMAFGFATFNMAVSRDDLEGNIYTGSGQNMLAAGRFTIYFVDRLTSTTIRGPAAAYISDILALLWLVWAAINFCIFFRRVCGKALSTIACTVFTCIFVSYPLITELWEYIGAYRVVAFGYLCDSFALLLMYDAIHEKSIYNRLRIPAACVLMMLVSAGYESLVPVYIFCVFAILALQVVYGSAKEKKLSEIIRQGLCYAGVLVAGLIMRVIAHKVILFVRHLEPDINGGAEFFWGTAPAPEIFIRTMLGILQDFILRAMVYFPLTELAVAAVIMLVIGIYLALRHGWTVLLPGLGMYFSLIILSLVQGCASRYRYCQVFGMFIAFTVMLIVILTEQANKKWLRAVVLFLCAYLCFHQADQTNYFLTLNYMRSEEEVAVVRDIGTDLYENFDTEKPVIFVGTYVLSEGITEAASIPESNRRWYHYERLHSAINRYISQYGLEMEYPSRKLAGSNVNSVIHFGRYAFEGNQESMKRLFSFCGFDYVLADCMKLQPEADAYVEENHIPAYPKSGYIQDVGDYIIIHIQ